MEEGEGDQGEDVFDGDLQERGRPLLGVMHRARR